MNFRQILLSSRCPTESQINYSAIWPVVIAHVTPQRLHRGHADVGGEPGGGRGAAVQRAARHARGQRAARQLHRRPRPARQALAAGMRSCYTTHVNLHSTRFSYDYSIILMF